jgi:hypothetical protein
MSQPDPTPPPYDPALRALLDADRPPPLPADFAERVVAASARRAAVSSGVRRHRPGGAWLRRHRFIVAAAASGLLASAAAATGALERVGIDLPPVTQWAEQVAQSFAPSPPAPAPRSRTAGPPPAGPADGLAGAGGGRVLTGPIDTPQELDTALARIDAQRQTRTDARRARVDGRIDEALARRRAAGLPAPNAEEEARLKQRLAQARERRDAQAQVRRETRREELRRRVEAGEAITPPARDPAAPLANRPKLRERLEQLPPEERQAIRERWQARRQQRLQQQRQAPAVPTTSTDAPEAAVPAPDSPQISPEN